MSGREESSVNGECKFIEVVSEGWPRRSYHGHHRFVVRHCCCFLSLVLEELTREVFAFGFAKGNREKVKRFKRCFMC